MSKATGKADVRDSRVVQDIPDIVNSHVKHLAAAGGGQSQTDAIYAALQRLLNRHTVKYIFDREPLGQPTQKALAEQQFQQTLAVLNEKQSVRRTRGVYYTPRDVIAFLVANCFSQLLHPSAKLVSGYRGSRSVGETEWLCCQQTVFDPTCGAGEFLLYAPQQKLALLAKATGPLADAAVLAVLGTIHGNDINAESVEITKTRLFFETIKHLADSAHYNHVVDVLDANLHTGDFVEPQPHRFRQYDMIVGNPPYVEDSKSAQKPANSYGNIYANVVENSLALLSEQGVMGFILPISYLSTPRMSKLRSYVEAHTSRQFVLSYADRPDCLFASVHQKLSILVATKGEGDHRLYTTGYRYWYKSEREALFAAPAPCANPYKMRLFYPKLGNRTELAIFRKAYTEGSDNLLDMALPGAASNLFLNMRACFWIKAFSFNPGSKEYKGFGYPADKRDFVLCLLNSSLYFLFWVTTSDCWHITAKELRHFRVPAHQPDAARFAALAAELEGGLERTKRFIGSKQTPYEYKHKLCKQVIDKIDDCLARLYGLSASEVEYIQNFALKYRESLGG